MDKHGNTRVHKYATSSSRVTINGVHAKEPQIKRISVFEASQRMPQKQKTRKTVALTKTVLKLLESKNDEEDHSRDLKKGKRPV
jgi:uncharacterized protein (DUF2141 family)